ncbi:MAG: hypothetical protein RLZ98_1424 [Pseudomonadota bacterium]|jgi:aminoglycoside phosphotransferase family enzyme/predicted kinase
MSEQNEVLAFLESPASYDPPPDRVERIETHGAFVFLAGETAIKIKRAVAFDYMDFSTRELREKAIRREFELNAPHAPELYLGLASITRNPAGGLQFNHDGETVELALRMHRFEQSALLSAMADEGKLDLDVARSIADAVFTYHEASDRHPGSDAAGSVRRIIEELEPAFATQRCDERQERPDELFAALRAHLVRTTPILQSRAAVGDVRRCHGDLHLRNIVMLEGRPVLFDALEFSEELATIDVLYDLAFLLMDLDVAGQRAEANAVLNRYLWRRNSERDLESLTLLPMFLALRAGIRAMVAMQRAAQQQADRPGVPSEVGRYLAKALTYVKPTPPSLMAIGGFSGTGKTTLARALAPEFGACPGALLIRSDLERKAMMGVEETERLPPESYTRQSSDAVYARVFAKAAKALAAGHSVVTDAVFSKPEEREAVEKIAHDAGVPFAGLWLTADRDTLVERVSARVGDASDATAEIVESQLAGGAGTIGWEKVAADDGQHLTRTRARRALADLGFKLLV